MNHEPMPRWIHSDLIADLAEDCGLPRDTTAGMLQKHLDARMAACEGNADRQAWIGAMQASLIAVLAVPVTDG